MPTLKVLDYIRSLLADKNGFYLDLEAQKNQRCCLKPYGYKFTVTEDTMNRMATACLKVRGHLGNILRFCDLSIFKLLKEDHPVNTEAWQ